MNRRDAIQRAALLLTGTFSAPTLMAMNRLESGILLNNTTFKLSALEQKMVAEVAEMIIPKSDTLGEASPGAKDAGVPAFIEMMLKDCYAAPQHEVFVAGLVALEQDKFLEMDTTARTERLKKLQAESKAIQGVTFWKLIKELTMLGYFTSEVGVKSSFEYVQIPTKFQATKLKPNQKAYAY